jgi:hypothetical protein
MITELQGVLKMKKWLMSAALFAAVAVLVGCSAGGKDQGGTNTGTGTGTGTTATAPTLAVALSSSTISESAPATVTATVRDSTGAALPNVVVDFTVNAAVGSLSSSSALTDAHGVASVTLSPAAATTSGADTVTASATVASLTGTASAGYQINSSIASIVSLVPNTGETASDALAAYGQGVLTLTTSGVSPTAPATINITSACVAAGKATISPATFNLTSNTTVFTYKDTGGCGSTIAADTVSASIAGSVGSTTVQINLTSPTANSITFTTAVPPTIYLKGSGNVESSTVSFEVVDTAGHALPGQVVTLNLSTFAGGVLLNQDTVPVHQTSDSNGLVSVIINSGTVPTPVRVIASLGSGASTVSSNLAIVTGLPSQINFSLSQGTINIEGANFDGTPNTYTVRAADRSGNPVPDSTAVLFWAEGGQIQGSTTTTTTLGTSSATAQFVSAEPRPLDGRVTVLAYAIGEESFLDLAGTNVYQAGDPFQDLGNVVKSKQFDGVYDAANDEVVSLSDLGAAVGGSSCVTSFNLNTYPQFALPNSIPNQPGTCDGVWTGKTYVRRAVETVFSSTTPSPMMDPALLPATCSQQSILIASPSQGPQVSMFPLFSVNLATNTQITNPTLYVGAATSGGFTFIASDDNLVRLNPMAAGTLISANSNDSTTIATAQVAVTGGTYVCPSTPNAQSVGVNYTFATLSGGGIAQSGSIQLNFVSKPSGTSVSVPVTLVRTDPPSTCTN